MRLQDRVIVVTGGSQGIGEALARRYAREGAGVAILDRDHASGAAVAESIAADGGRAVAMPAMSPTSMRFPPRWTPSTTRSARWTCWSTTPARS